MSSADNPILNHYPPLTTPRILLALWFFVAGVSAQTPRTNLNTTCQQVAASAKKLGIAPLECNLERPQLPVLGEHSQCEDIPSNQYPTATATILNGLETLDDAAAKLHLDTLSRRVAAYRAAIRCIDHTKNIITE